MLRDAGAIEISPDQPPVLLCCIAIEEEFDWQAEFDRGATAVTHLAQLEEGLTLLKSLGVRPVGLVTYPVVDVPASATLIREFVQRELMVLGAHLHPWVTPPFSEQVTRRNSFAGNLARQVEKGKLEALAARIEETVGERPRIYQAGRYGVGPNSYDILAELGFAVSASVTPPFDFSGEGGPDYTSTCCDPHWVSVDPPVLELPVTGAFLGSAARFSAPLYRAATARALAWSHLPGVLARLRIVERMRLSPEGHTHREMIRLTRGLLERGTRVFALSFHSPTLKPGLTPYVRSAADRAEFLDRLRAYIDFFLGKLNGRAATPLEMHQRLLAEHAPRRTEECRRAR